MLLALAVGLPAVRLLDRRANAGEAVAMAVLVGLAALGVILFALSLTGIRWTRLSFVGAAVILSGVLVFFAMRRRSEPSAAVVRDVRGSVPWMLAIHALTVLVLFGYTRFATAAPIWEFDFLSDWGLKGRVFFLHGGIDWRFLETAWYRSTHPDYPPLLPLLFDGAAVLEGAWNDQALGLLYPMFAAAATLFVISSTHRETGHRVVAAVVGLCTVSLACTPWIGLADGPFAAYVAVALLLLRRDVMQTATAAAVLLGAAAFLKNEGLTLLISAAIAVLISAPGRHRLRSFVKLWPGVAIASLWLLMRAWHGLANDVVSGSASARLLARIADPREIIHAFAQYSVGKPVFWSGIVLALLLCVRSAERRDWAVLVAIVVQAIFYIAAYLATPHDVSWHVRWSWERLVTHLVLTLATLLFLMLSRELAAREKAVSES